MLRNYTVLNQKNVFDHAFHDDMDAIDDHTINTVDFIKNIHSFRTFDQGLIELLKRNSYSGSLENKAEMSDHLIDKLREIGSTIKKETVYSWFTGKHRPKIEPGYRRQIYEICFAMHLSYEDTVWFFQHVYYDRAFNCHTIDEAVFYYAFLNQLTYSEALSIIDRINRTASAADTADDTEPDYTHWVQSQIPNFQSTAELETFLSSQKNHFNSWNKSAFRHLNSLIDEMIASDEAKAKIDNLKRAISREGQKQNPDYRGINLKISSYETSFQGCGLLMKEVFYDALHSTEPAYIKVKDAISIDTDSKPKEERIKKKGIVNIQKSTFLLDRLLSTVAGIPKIAEGLPDKFPDNFRNIFCHNFPSKKILSDVLSESKVTKSKSYDSIRKMIILLDFYAFWIPIKIQQTDTAAYSNSERYRIYVDEADYRLFQCGYEDLYPGNPYDWLFLCAAQSDDPLFFFRTCINALLDA